jgi:hypothetical protein
MFNVSTSRICQYAAVIITWPPQEFTFLTNGSKSIGIWAKPYQSIVIEPNHLPTAFLPCTNKNVKSFRFISFLSFLS